MNAISVKDISKEYRLGQLVNLLDSVKRLASRLRGRELPQAQYFKALDGIDFQVKKGEVLGIIGTNGAGKSTLLKILAGITTPTGGELEVHGTIAPLIEVGSGLVPDMTGRENIYINGAILGIPRRVIESKVDEIIAFAELEEFIETPVKRYSSGMRIRLGFAIATAVDPDILIVDEVLAVGDLAFQRKCFNRMDELIRQRGKTVLLVSHNIRQVERICSRVILLDNGKILSDGDPSEVCNLFYQRSNEKVHEQAVEMAAQRARIESSGELDLLAVELLDDTGREVEQISSGDALRIRIRFNLRKPLVKPRLIVGTHTTDFIYLTGASTGGFAERPDLEPGEHEIEHIIPAVPFAPGVYCVRFVVYDEYLRNVFSGETLKMFSVVPGAGEVHNVKLRTLELPTEWVLGGHRFNVSDRETPEQSPTDIISG